MDDARIHRRLDSTEDQHGQEETEQNMYDAIELHIEGLLEDNLPIPEAKTFSEYVLLKEPTRQIV